MSSVPLPIPAVSSVPLLPSLCPIPLLPSQSSVPSQSLPSSAETSIPSVSKVSLLPSVSSIVGPSESSSIPSPVSSQSVVNSQQLPSPCPLPTVFSKSLKLAISENKISGNTKLQLIREACEYYALIQLLRNTMPWQGVYVKNFPN